MKLSYSSPAFSLSVAEQDSPSQAKGRRVFVRRKKRDEVASSTAAPIASLEDTPFGRQQKLLAHRIRPDQTIQLTNGNAVSMPSEGWEVSVRAESVRTLPSFTHTVCTQRDALASLAYPLGRARVRARTARAHAQRAHTNKH